MERLDGAGASRSSAVLKDEQAILLGPDPLLIVPGFLDAALDIQRAGDFLLALLGIEELEGGFSEGGRGHQPGEFQFCLAQHRPLGPQEALLHHDHLDAHLQELVTRVPLQRVGDFGMEQPDQPPLLLEFFHLNGLGRVDLRLLLRPQERDFELDHRALGQFVHFEYPDLQLVSWHIDVLVLALKDPRDDSVCWDCQLRKDLLEPLEDAGVVLVLLMKPERLHFVAAGV
eukprot:755095-Hanusia_phi.AAC.6